MLDDLILVNYPSGFSPKLPEEHGCFLLETCQRTLLVGFDKRLKSERNIQYEIQMGPYAYSFLLETICGLKSKLIGENEIVSQFRNAYYQYLDNNQRDNRLLKILEKLFQDAKRIRSQYLMGITQKTYASLARKKMIQAGCSEKVLITGSGSLAEDLINQFKKKVDVFISARNSKKVQHLQSTHNLKVINWFDQKEISKFPFIVNSIGCQDKIFTPNFFENWKCAHNLFLDLGSPSCLEFSHQYKSKIMLLADVLEEGAIHEDKKREQVNNAIHAIKEITEHRQNYLNKSWQKRIQILKFNKIHA